MAELLCLPNVTAKQLSAPKDVAAMQRILLYPQINVSISQSYQFDRVAQVLCSMTNGGFW